MEGLTFGAPGWFWALGLLPVLVHGRARDICIIGLGSGVDKLEILGDEIDIDHAAGGILQIPDVVLALFQCDRVPHVRGIPGDARCVAGPHQHVTNDFFDLAAKRRRG